MNTSKTIFWIYISLLLLVADKIEVKGSVMHLITECLSAFCLYKAYESTKQK